MTRKTTLYYSSALAGAGKTYALARLAHSWASQGQKVLFVQSTKELIDKTVEKELGVLAPIRHRVIHGDTESSVVAEIVRHFNNAGAGGEILFITHAAFLRVPYFQGRERWIVIVDEVLDVDAFVQFNLPETGHLITPHIATEPFDARYALANPAGPEGRATLRAIADNKRSDDVWKLFRDVAQRMLDPKWTSRPRFDLRCPKWTGSMLV